MSTLTENRPQRNIMQELRGTVAMRVGKSILGDSEAGPREESPENWSTSLTPRVKPYYRRMWASLEFQMEACSSVRGSLGVSRGALRATKRRNIPEAH